MNPLSEESRKRMTEFLGECWHERLHDPKYMYDFCGKCGRPWHEGTIKFRTFTTWQDLGDLKEKLVEKGLWDDFENFALSKKNEKFVSMVSLSNYLINPAIFIPLVNEFLKEERS